MIGYICSFIYLGLFSVIGVASFLYQITLPTYVITGLVCLLLGMVMFQNFAKQAEDRYNKEQKNEIPE
jgi:uncharacterized membrane protein YuzA (DUF378 family)